MEAQGGGCPVRHSSPSQGATSSSGSPEESSSVTAPRHQHQQRQQSTAAASAASGGGLWSGVALWIPFRGSRNDQKRQEPTTDIQTRTSTASGHSTSACPVVSDSTGSPQPADAESSGCPAKRGSAVSSAGNGNGSADSPSPAFNVLNNEFAYGQELAPDQAIPLSTSRQQSSIPKADFNPTHQPKDAPTWVYPSEQQYYNAIRRKGHKASARDMPTTLAIHNAVNEKGWAMVTEWERLHAGGDFAEAHAPKLLRFEGRPKDTSPKAWIKSTLLGYTPPFDRHDWVVQRPDGTEARYVIDFYSGHVAPGSFAPIAMHLDVRPALDSVDAAVDRARMFYQKKVRLYFRGVLDSFKNGSTSNAASEDAPRPPPAPGPPASAGGR